MPKYSNATGKGRTAKRKVPIAYKEREKTFAGQTGGKAKVRGKDKKEAKLLKKLAAASRRVSSEGSPAERLLLARRRRAAATSQKDLDKIHRMLGIILVDAAEGSEVWNDAGKFLATLLLGSRLADGSIKSSGKVDGKITRLLEERGFEYRLSHRALALSHDAPGAPPRTSANAWDGALPTPLLEKLSAALAPNSLFWKRHSYSDGSGGVSLSPHFSYVVPLVNNSDAGKNNPTDTTLMKTIRTVQDRIAVDFPEVRDCAAAEWWAHCRPHCSGQQLHFESDDDDASCAPVAKTVLCLSERSAVGGETLVTTQTATDPVIASNGWLCAGRRNRLLGFDGSLLHGVIPGHGADVPHKRERRVTFMISFWKSARVQEGPGPGAARPFSKVEKEEWAQTLTEAATKEEEEEEEVAASLATDCFFEVPVWEDVDSLSNAALGKSIQQMAKENSELPPYDSFFQFLS